MKTYILQVSSHMMQKSVISIWFKRTMRARKGLFPCVNSNMFCQIWFVTCLIWTVWAGKRLFACVSPVMFCKVRASRADIRAMWTVECIWSLSAVAVVPLNASSSSLLNHLIVITQPHLWEMFILNFFPVVGLCLYQIFLLLEDYIIIFTLKWSHI